jgi:N-succinyldiaminopimelate aminotransferase
MPTASSPDVYTATNQLAQQYSAVNLGQGAPDFDGPPQVLRAATAAITSGRNQYSPPSGLPELRLAIARHAATHGLSYDPDTEIIVTAGCTEALAAALFSVVRPGSEVICLEPFYDYYPVMVAQAGGVFVPASLSFDLSFDPAVLKSAITSKTSAIMLNSPHNPTGLMLSSAELAEIGNIARNHNLTIISDEVYEELTYDREHTSPAALPELRDRVIVCSSASKCLSVCGWRIGWAMASAALACRLGSAHRHLTACAPTPLQIAVAEGLNWAHDNRYFDCLRAEYAQRRDIIYRAIQGSGMEPVLPAGGFVLLARTGGLLPTDPLAANELLARTRGVAGLPVPTFFSSPRHAAGLLRFSFCKRTEVLREAARRLIEGVRVR